MIYVTIFRKKLSSLPVSDYVIKFYILHQILFFLHFEATVSYLKLSAHKEQPNTHDLSMLIKKWILVAPCFTYHSVKECELFLFCLIFRLWFFRKKWSAMKDLSSDIQYDYVPKKNIPTNQLWRHNILYLTCISFSLHFEVIVIY